MKQLILYQRAAKFHEDRRRMVRTGWNENKWLCLLFVCTVLVLFYCLRCAAATHLKSTYAARACPRLTSVITQTHRQMERQQVTSSVCIWVSAACTTCYSTNAVYMLNGALCCYGIGSIVWRCCVSTLVHRFL